MSEPATGQQDFIAHAETWLEGTVLKQSGAVFHSQLTQNET